VIAEMGRGVNLTLKLEMADHEMPVEAVMIDCSHEPFDHPSTLIGQLPTLQGGRTAEVTVAPGSYERTTADTSAICDHTLLPRAVWT